MEKSTEEIPFLDMSVKLKNDKTETDLYCKETDSHNYLLYSSAHPLACKNSIPYSQFLRVRKICTNLCDFDKHATILGAHFRRRGYPEPLLERAVLKARRLDRQSILKPKDKTENKDKLERPVLVTTYHPHDNTLKNIVGKNWDLLGKSTTTTFLHQHKPLLSYKRPKSLLDILVKADIRTKDQIEQAKKLKREKTNNFLASITEEITFKTQKTKQTSIRNFFQPSTSRVETENPTSVANKQHSHYLLNPDARPKLIMACPKFRCKYCPYLDTSGEITSHTTGQKFETKINVHCHSSNLVYVITCKLCGKHYVGETQRKLFERFREHLRSITYAQECQLNPSLEPLGHKQNPVGIHFAQKGHNGTKDVKIQILDFINLHPESKKAKKVRLRVEKKWIHTLRCPAPNGMNIFD
jgi:hypothetical protein